MASLTPITGSLGLEKAAHLLRRATFGPTRTEIVNFSTLTVTDALTALLTALPPPAQPIDPLTDSTWLPEPVSNINSGDDSLFKYFKAWFLELMRTRGTNLTERMVYFYHTHMPADHNLIQNATSIYYQNALYRYYALGNFKTLFTKVTLDNAMLLYIDNTLNDFGNPNENYAREMFELYSIGKGEQIGPEDYTNYTETDIKEAAKVLTGFKHDFEFATAPLDSDTGLPRGKATVNGQTQAYRHDPGVKTFTSKFQNTTIQPNPAMMVGGYATEEGALDEIDQMMDMIFAQAETAKFICRKLYRFFIYYQITDEIENDIITPLATTFINGGFEIQPVLRQLLSSEHFYDTNNTSSRDVNIGALIKSPIELVVGTLRFFNISMPSDVDDLYDVAYSTGILTNLKNQGMDFFTPIDVAGYPPYHQVPAYNRNWISPNYLARRYQFGQQIIDGIEDDMGTSMYKLDIVAYVDDINNISDASNARTIVTELTNFMFTTSIPTERYDYFLDSVFLDDTSEAHWTDAWTDYKNTLDDSVVRALLERLVSAIMQSPEYQLF